MTQSAPTTPPAIPSDVGDNTIVSWAADLIELEGQITDLQDAKKRVYASIREDHGRVLADAVKNAVRLSRMDDEKRELRDDIDTETERVFAIISRGARAPRVCPREIIEQFDAETGEITEPAIAADQGGEGEPGHGTILPAEPIDREEEGSLETGHLSSGQRPEGDPVNPEAGAVIDVGAGESPATLHPAALNALKLRPYCLHASDLTKCAGVGKKHCAICLAAHADAEGMSA